jgi:type IV pilus assembly protein PilC
MEDIKKGEGVYNSFKKRGLGNNLFLSLVRTGEETGSLDNMMLKAGEIFSKDVEESFRKIASFIEPITIIFLALFIGVFAIAAIMPMFSIMDSIN